VLVTVLVRGVLAEHFPSWPGLRGRRDASTYGKHRWAGRAEPRPLRQLCPVKARIPYSRHCPGSGRVPTPASPRCPSGDTLTPRTGTIVSAAIHPMPISNAASNDRMPTGLSSPITACPAGSVSAAQPRNFPLHFSAPCLIIGAGGKKWEKVGKNGGHSPRTPRQWNDNG